MSLFQDANPELRCLRQAPKPYDEEAQRQPAFGAGG